MPAGTDNIVFIQLNGVSKKAFVDATPSTPIDPTGTDVVTIDK